jgi:hypothetical protein
MVTITVLSLIFAAIARHHGSVDELLRSCPRCNGVDLFVEAWSGGDDEVRELGIGDPACDTGRLTRQDLRATKNKVLVTKHTRAIVRPAARTSHDPPEDGEGGADRSHPDVRRYLRVEMGERGIQQCLSSAAPLDGPRQSGGRLSRHRSQPYEEVRRR